jgi:DNA topoisomerase-6 subunit B
MKACLSDLYRKVSAQIRKELRMKEAASRLSLYKFYIPLIVSAISESITIDSKKLEQAFTELAEKHVSGEVTGVPPAEKEDEITAERVEEEAEETVEAEIDGEVVKRDKKQIAINAARKKGERSRPKKEGQTTLDAIIEKKGRKK